jgi:hypothetical protein
VQGRNCEFNAGTGDRLRRAQQGGIVRAFAQAAGNAKDSGHFNLPFRKSVCPSGRCLFFPSVKSGSGCPPSFYA